MQTILLLTLAMAQFALALNPGDIAFTSFNAEEDGFCVVALVNIPSPTTVFFTDRAVAGAGWSASNLGRDGAITWSITSNIAAGTVVRFSAVDTASIAVSTGTVARSVDSFNLSPAGDTLIAYQGGGSISSSTGLLASVSTDGTIPVGLVAGDTAVAIASSAEFREYVGPRATQSSFSAYRALINTDANWNGPPPMFGFPDGEAADDVPNTAAFTITTSVIGDPHVFGANGIKIDFHGKPSANYTLLAAPGFEITMQMAGSGPSMRFISRIGLLFRGASLEIGPFSLNSPALAAQLAALGAKVIVQKQATLSVELCSGHIVSLTVHHTVHAPILNYLEVKVQVPGCHNAYQGVLGQTYQCRWATEQFAWSEDLEESFRVPTLATVTSSSAHGACIDGDDYVGGPTIGSSK